MGRDSVDNSTKKYVLIGHDYIDKDIKMIKTWSWNVLSFHSTVSKPRVSDFKHTIIK